MVYFEGTNDIFSFLCFVLTSLVISSSGSFFGSIFLFKVTLLILNSAFIHLHTMNFLSINNLLAPRLFIAEGS